MVMTFWSIKLLKWASVLRLQSIYHQNSIKVLMVCMENVLGQLQQRYNVAGSPNELCLMFSTYLRHGNYWLANFMFLKFELKYCEQQCILNTSFGNALWINTSLNWVIWSKLYQVPKEAILSRSLNSTKVCSVLLTPRKVLQGLHC